MYQKIISLFTLLFFLSNAGSAQFNTVIEQKLSSRMFRVKKTFDRVYPNNPTAKILDIRIARNPEIPSPIYQKAFTIMQVNKKGKEILDPENILFVQGWEKLDFQDRQLIKGWTKMMKGKKDPEKLYYDLICYFVWPSELMQELPNTTGKEINTLYDFRKMTSEFTLYYLAKQNYTGKFNQFRAMLKLMQKDCSAIIGKRSRRVALIKEGAQVKNMIEYWYVQSSFLLEVYNDIQESSNLGN